MTDAIYKNLLQSLCEGLVAFGTLESRSGMGNALCESIFYLPLLRISKHRSWTGLLEQPLLSASIGQSGDYPRVDYYGNQGGYGIGIEVKFVDRYSRLGTFSTNELRKLNILATERREDHPNDFRGYRLLIGRAKKSNDIHAYRLRSADQELSPCVAIHFKESTLSYFCLAVRVV